jgi:hypothetical protein
VRVTAFDAFRRLIEPALALATHLTLEQSIFTAACTMLTMCRFPAGEHDWKVSGVPRSLLRNFECRRLLPLISVLGVQMRGVRLRSTGRIGGMNRPPQTRGLSGVI